MIIKLVPMRSLGKSDFADLTNYITDAQSKDHRLGQVAVTNCEAFSVRDAIAEVLATQHLNTRATGDKTYHLIVSFRAGENPDAATLKAIEHRICQGIGFEEHQRISAVHNDTDNLHIHIAINKIHPRRRTMHEPYYPHLMLADLCTTLEQEYGLQKDNHIPRQRGAASRAADMECHSGVESLVGWIKRVCLDDIQDAKSWQELHQVMRSNGLEIRQRGNGLVIRADDGTMVKPSTLARDLSKPALEKRLGSFEPSVSQQPESSQMRRYRKDPIRLRVDTTELYARYKAEQQNLTAHRTKALEAARLRKDKKVAQAKAAGQRRRSVIKHMTQGSVVKRMLYAQASKALRDELQAINTEYKAHRQDCHDQHTRRTWADWLKREAASGHAEALTALRARDAAQGLQGNTIAGHGHSSQGPAALIDGITKKGTIIYRAGKNAVRDDGDKLQISQGADNSSLQEALRLAVDRYGNRINVTGTVEFKAQMIRAAANSQLAITFSDPALEKHRQALVEKQGKHPERVRKPRVWPFGKAPPPILRGQLRPLSEVQTLNMSGDSKAAPIQAPLLSTEHNQRTQLQAKLQAELKAKKEQAKRGKGRSR